MRSATPTEIATALDPARAQHRKLEIKDSAGAWRDVSAFLIGGELANSIDQATWTGTFRLKREAYQSGTLVSLSPLVATSPLNMVAGSYSPLIHSASRWRLSIATHLRTVAPVSGDWKPVLEGKVDKVGWPQSPITLTVRDMAGVLADAQIEAERPYGSDLGVAAEDVMQQIIDDTMGALTVPLTVVGGPTWMMGPFVQKKARVLDALRTLAQQRGWDVRYTYDAAGTFALRLFQIDRTKTTPDLTLAAGQYRTVSTLEESDDAVRNRIRATGIDGETAEPLESFKEDTGSEAVYGPRFMEIDYTKTDNLDSQSELDTLVDIALSDLSTPPLAQATQHPFLWFAELGDLYRYTADGKRYTDDQDLGVTGITHTFADDGRNWTSTQNAGNIKGQFRAWINLQGQGITDARFLPNPSIGEAFGESTARDGTATLPDGSPAGAAGFPITLDQYTDILDIYCQWSATLGQPVPAETTGNHVATIVRKDGDFASSKTWGPFHWWAFAPPGVEVIWLIRASGKADPTTGERRVTRFVRRVITADTGTAPSGPPSDLQVEDISSPTNGVALRVSCAAPDAAATGRLWMQGGILWTDQPVSGGRITFDVTHLTSGQIYTPDIDTIRDGQTTVFASVGGTVALPNPTGGGGTPPIDNGGTSDPVAPSLQVFAGPIPQADGSTVPGWTFVWSDPDASSTDRQIAYSTTPDGVYTDINVTQLSDMTILSPLPTASSGGDTYFKATPRAGTQRYFQLRTYRAGRTPAYLYSAAVAAISG